jgi:hypothetical protein
VRCHGEAAKSVLAIVRGDVFARFRAVAAKRRIKTRNSRFGLLGPVLRATATVVQMAAPAWNILDTALYVNITLFWRVTSCGLQKDRLKGFPMDHQHIYTEDGGRRIGRTRR